MSSGQNYRLSPAETIMLEQARNHQYVVVPIGGLNQTSIRVARDLEYRGYLILYRESITECWYKLTGSGRHKLESGPS